MERRHRRDENQEEALARLLCLPPAAQHEAMLSFFTSGLRQLSSRAIREMRVELVREFPLCPCGCDNRPLLFEIVEGHLALRDLGLERGGDLL